VRVNLIWMGKLVAFDPVRYLKEVRSEVARVRWPTRKETLVTTGMVLVMVILTALFFGVVDAAIGYVVRLIFTPNS